MDPLHPKNLFTSQPAQTAIRPAMYQKDDGHIPLNLAFSEQLGRSTWTRSLHPDAVTGNNVHLSDTAFRCVNELNAALSAVASSSVPTLVCLRRMSSVNDAVTQLLSHF